MDDWSRRKAGSRVEDVMSAGDVSDLNGPDELGDGMDSGLAKRFREAAESLGRAWEEKDGGEFMESAEAMMSLAMEWSESSPPDPLESALEMALERLDWEEALRLRGEMIARERANPDSVTLWLLLSKLAAQYYHMGRYKEGLEVAQESVRAAVEAGMPAGEIHCAEVAAVCALGLGELDRAMERVGDGLKAAASPEGAGPMARGVPVARLTLLRGRCHLARGELEAAEEDLAAASRELEWLKEVELPGVRAARASSLELAGLILREQGETVASLERFEEAVELRRMNAVVAEGGELGPQVSLGRALVEYRRALRAAGRQATAEVVEREIDGHYAKWKMPRPESGW